MLAIPADVTDVSSIAAASMRIREQLGPIDVAILSAGYWKPMDPAYDSGPITVVTPKTAPKAP